MPLDQTSSTLVFKDGTAPLTFDVTFSTPPAVGSTVFVPVCLWYGGTADQGIQNLISATDNRGNGSYVVTAQFGGISPKSQAYIVCKKISATGSPFTVTLQFSAADPGELYVGCRAFSWTGVDDVVDKTVGASSTHTTSASLTTPALAVDGQLVIAVASLAAQDTNLNIVQAVGGYTNFYLQNNSIAHLGATTDYKTVTGLGAQTTTWTFDDAIYAVLIATFPLVAGVGSAMQRRQLIPGMQYGRGGF